MLNMWLQKILRDQNHSMKRVVDRVRAMTLLYQLLWASSRLPPQIQHTRSVEQLKNVLENCVPIGICSAFVAMRTLFMRVM